MVWTQQIDLPLCFHRQFDCFELHVFMSLENSLAQLALEAPEGFPHLKKLHIGFVQRVSPVWKDSVERTKAVAMSFEAAGIDVTWGIGLMEPVSETIIPGAMNWLTWPPFPTFDGASERYFESPRRRSTFNLDRYKASPNECGA
jgi:hypothetical protein